MASLPKQLLKQLELLQRVAQDSFQRRLVVLSGQEEWVQDTLLSLLPQLKRVNTLTISDQNIVFEGELTSASKLKTYLGSEVDRIIWDGFSGLNPDSFGAASGLLRGGGLFFLLLPDLNTFAQAPDPDYIRMCSGPDELPQCGTRFLKRLIRLIYADANVFLFEQGQPIPNVVEHVHDAIRPLSLPTTDQLTLIDEITSVATGHHKRPLVVLADRGRGKTSALGLAAATIAKQEHLKVLITAPSQRACAAAFKHFRLQFPDIDANERLQLTFIPPDELIEQTPECHLLLVDEAAAVPSPALKAILLNYPRVVFSSTTHGYEGNGNGFAVRFKKELDTITPQWRSITLKQPIRWATNDPLEEFTFKFLLLNAQLPEISFDLKDSTPEVQWLSQDELVNNEALLSHIISLLVLAHYQTSPSDIRLILDHPRIKIATLFLPISKNRQNLVGVMLLIEEGGIEDDILAQGVFEGTRRPRGHLVPQSLLAYSGNYNALSQRTYRVMRIAIHPDDTRKGFGSMLLHTADEYAARENIDSISTSFGITPELMTFWIKNNFHPVKLGSHKDGASGTQSAILFKAISKPALVLSNQLTAQFNQKFLVDLLHHHRQLPADTALAILSCLNLNKAEHSKIRLSKQALTELYAYAEHHRSFDDSLLVLSTFMLNCFANGSMSKLDHQSTFLIIMRIFQGQDIKTCVRRLKLDGKKELAKMIKGSTLKLLGN